MEKNIETPEGKMRKRLWVSGKIENAIISDKPLDGDPDLERDLCWACDDNPIDVVLEEIADWHHEGLCKSCLKKMLERLEV